MMEINLLPSTSYWNRPVRSGAWVWALALAVVVAAALVVGWTQRQSAAAARAMSQTLDAQVGSLRLEIARVQATPSQPVTAVTDVADLVTDVHEVLPEGVTLSSIAWSNGQVTLAGQADSLAHLTAYQRALGKLPECTSVWVDSAARGQSGYQFSIHIQWKAGVS
ncbi:MAG: PilN domain-containing protein [Thermoflavifilum sp.]|nr:PilN domain-containing protein [Thermoflavifilum sp.]MCL6514505.1 PilN domain-containing protein [Alicyclobacillus sp.]